MHVVTPPELAEADDPNKLIEIESGKTDVNGVYVFRTLGADRFFVLARCNETQTGPKNAALTWAPMLYPDVNSFDTAQEILLLPSAHRAGIDFHMQRKRTYSLEGKIIFNDRSAPKPWPRAIYSQDLCVLRTDRALTSTSVGQEFCRIDANAGTFRCDSLLPGDYTLYFRISAGLGAAGSLPPQAAKVRYDVKAAPRQTLTVQLKEVPNGGVVYKNSYKGPVGNLELGKVCAVAADGRPAIRVLAWGHGRAGAACYYMTFWGATSLPLPKDYYNVNAFEAAFVSRNHHSYLGNSSKVEALLMQHGTGVKLEVGETIKPSLPVLTTRQLIEIALSSLKTAR
jgi:hypothetical protein